MEVQEFESVTEYVQFFFRYHTKKVKSGI